MSEEAHTPEEIAREVHSIMRREMDRAKLQVISRSVEYLCGDDQPLAAYHFLRQSGADEGKSLAVLDELERAGEVMDLLAVEKLSERADN